jgi:hypothetical protein
MASMGIYCKAYPISSFQQFSGWNLNGGPFQLNRSGDGATEGVPDTQDYLFLQENYTVTANVYLDEGIVYDNITPEWVEFCKNVLRFEVPADVLQAEEEAAAHGTA